jgi:tRNA uridine 5-carboxymethylaminomethyl modification enzyme
LSSELRQKLEAARPASLARAARIPGMTPAALSLLLVHARRRGATARTAAMTGGNDPDAAVGV